MKNVLPRYSLTTRLAGLLTVVLGTMVTGSCGGGGLVLESHWRERPIVIDGIDDEWAGRVRRFEEARVVIGIMNDDEFVYVMMATSARSAQFHHLASVHTPPVEHHAIVIDAAGYMRAVLIPAIPADAPGTGGQSLLRKAANSASAGVENIHLHPAGL